MESDGWISGVGGKTVLGRWKGQRLSPQGGGGVGGGVRCGSPASIWEADAGGTSVDHADSSPASTPPRPSLVLERMEAGCSVGATAGTGQEKAAASPSPTAGEGMATMVSSVGEVSPTEPGAATATTAQARGLSMPSIAAAPPPPRGLLCPAPVPRRR
jgi:hypothetical protein